MTRLTRTALAAALALGGALGATGTATAAMPSAAPLAGIAAADATLLEDVRYVTRCRPVTVVRRDRFGRPVSVSRNVCRQVWVGRGRPYRGY
ncbi:hypothetical protein ACE7GA_13770 [Roseomonas sp. CCTCC AB2023176]|uniref:hypothetical protein n=1 Tax=Roseomonas sp. CCTCC AB2023176 TaxID=3342640 RepID=UPI0035E10EF4